MGAKVKKDEDIKYLIDTNIIVDYLRVGEEKATEFLKRVEENKIKASISVITEYELLVFLKNSKTQLLMIKKLLSLLPSISITTEIVKQAVKSAQKYQLGIADSLIAATAFITKSILVSRDKIFTKIKELKVEPLK